MTISEQRGEDPLWGGPHVDLCSQPCAVLHRSLRDSSQAQYLCPKQDKYKNLSLLWLSSPS